MRGQIRKLSVGNGHPDQMMHYQVGKIYTLSGNSYELTDIMLDTELFDRGLLSYNIYIANSDGKVLWKSITGMPTVIEYNINFE